MVPNRHPTADRLIKVGLELFAAHGVAGTPIVRIEEAAGLAPGSGAFYKHFRSKDELLDAAIEDAEEFTGAGAELFAAFEAADLLDEARFIARGTWLMFDSHRDLSLVMTRETVRPPRYTHGPDGWPGYGFAFVADWLQRKVDAGEVVVPDPHATAMVLMDALTDYWLQRQVEADEPYGVGQERFLDAWVGIIAGLKTR